MRMRYVGLTWDHPRGRGALVAAGRHAESLGIEIAWSAQPLDGFESHPIEDLASRYDLVVIDHPHVGAGAGKGVLRPLDDLFPADVLAEIEAATIGPCFDSYRYAGHVWALPLDAASQVMVFRPDLLNGPAPRTWQDVVTYSLRRGRVALSTAGPHALLTLFSIVAALGGDVAEGREGRTEALVGEDEGVEALELMGRLFARGPRRAHGLNPIGLHEAMAATDEIALCPLVYGYVNYAVPGPGRRPLRFVDAPRRCANGRPGSTLGGTGIAVSARCSVSQPLLEHLRWLMSASTQVEFIPEHDGQPSCRSAWLDAALNARWGGFYLNCAETLERAFVRPRHPGYVAFQGAGSVLLREALLSGSSPRQAVRKLNRLYRGRFAHQRKEGARV